MTTTSTDHGPDPSRLIDRKRGSAMDAETARVTSWRWMTEGAHGAFGNPIYAAFA
jgi:hypothetical protein